MNNHILASALIGQIDDFPKCACFLLNKLSVRVARWECVCGDGISAKADAATIAQGFGDWVATTTRTQ